ncbi:MAG: carbohydrate binding domain-containing protein [Verrucomicrobia bacterium]|nr:carbohydrate binding domain-containing protein [Verrucomicrobiota bacterium]
MRSIPARLPAFLSRLGGVLGLLALTSPPLAAADRPHVLPSVRTFMNFGGDAAWMSDKIDLGFRLQAKEARPSHLAIRYALVCTLLEPSEKAEALRAWCRDRKLDYEDCFIHFAADTPVTLHVGAEEAANPRETRTIPGWDPRNDRDGDGRLSDAEFSSRANPKASARERRTARVPIYYWGPPADDFVMHVGFAGYQDFLAARHAPEVAAGWDGIFFDTVPDEVAGPGRTAAVAEYPRVGPESDRWARDLQSLFAKVKARQPEKLFVANGWQADPLVVDGFQLENWLGLATPAHEWRRRIDRARDHDRKGHVQLLQYNPVHDPALVPFGTRLPGVDRGRDQIYGLASYLMAHGAGTYFGFGLHPYTRVTELWFDAIRVDLGQPAGEMRPWQAEDRSGTDTGPNLLRNGSLDSFDDWRVAEGIVLDTAVKREGVASVRIESADPKPIRIHSQHLLLKPNTAFTLSAWIKTEAVRGGIGAQVYPYDFAGATTSPAAMLTVTGTTDWTRHEMSFTTADDEAGRISFRLSEALGTAWIDDLRLTEGAPAPVTPVFAREFTRGLVLVRPPAGPDLSAVPGMRLILPSPMKRLRADGRTEATVNSIQLRDGEAAILLHP